MVAIRLIPLITALVVCVCLSVPAFAGVPTTIDDFFLFGSQPGESGTLEGSRRCGNCHAGYDRTIEPYTNWEGSMMAQAQRDPLYRACMAVANQDAPDSGDLLYPLPYADGLAGGSKRADRWFRTGVLVQ
jgi:hypothetical protein